MILKTINQVVNVLIIFMKTNDIEIYFKITTPTNLYTLFISIKLLSFRL